MIVPRSLRNLLIAAIVLLVTNIIVTAVYTPPVSNAQVVSRAKVMYKVARVRYDEQSIQTAVDLFARDGWELVSHYNDILIFKK